MRQNEFEERAEQILRDHNLLSLPIDPVVLASRENIVVRNAKFSDDSIAGALSRRGDSISMLIAADDANARKRFSVAHELGHHFLGHIGEDQDLIDHVDDMYRAEFAEFEKSGRDRKEIAANQFAAALLMPATLVRQQWQITPSVDLMAKSFQVSLEAMGYRLSSLGVL